MKPNLIHSNPINHKKDGKTLFAIIFRFCRGVSIAPQNHNHKRDYANLTAFRAIKCILKTQRLRVFKLFLCFIHVLMISDSFRTKAPTLTIVRRFFPICSKVGQACETQSPIFWRKKSNKIPQKPFKMTLEMPRNDMPAWGGEWVGRSGAGVGGRSSYTLIAVSNDKSFNKSLSAGFPPCLIKTNQLFLFVSNFSCPLFIS